METPPGLLRARPPLGGSWVKDTLGRIALALPLIVVFCVASTVAVFAGCAAVTGPPDFR